jgi:hypothetical protein
MVVRPYAITRGHCATRTAADAGSSWAGKRMKSVSKIVVSTMLFLCATNAGAITGTDSTAIPLQPAWELTLERPINGIALSSRGDCAAVTTEDAVVILDRTGRVLWRWDFKRTNRYMVAGRVAVSPSCEMVAFTGDASYRYTWIVHRSGHRIPIRTGVTPLGVAISHRGNLVVIGTSGNIVRLFTESGALRWKWALMAGCCVYALSFSDDDRAVVISSGGGGGVLMVDREVKWTAWFQTIHASRDLKTFVGTFEPPHGPGFGHVTVLDQNGKELWSRISSLPDAIISPSGDEIVAWVDQKQDPTKDDDEQEGSLQVISRQGQTTGTLPDGRPFSFSSDGRRLLVMKPEILECMDLSGVRLWSIHVDDYPTLALMEDLTVILTCRGDRVSWFAPRN